MSEFEYLAVFVSIIFGISVTHILRGTIRSIYRGEIDHTHFVLTAFLFFVLILNWWVGFSWVKQEVWSFDLFIVIVIWSVSHYLAAITLYPPLSAGIEHPFEFRRNWFLWAFFGLGLADIIQAIARGAVFTPRAYLPFVLHYMILSMLAIYIKRPWFYRVIAWYFLMSMLIWSFVVRRFLA